MIRQLSIVAVATVGSVAALGAPASAATGPAIPNISIDVGHTHASLLNLPIGQPGVIAIGEISVRSGRTHASLLNLTLGQPGVPNQIGEITVGAGGRTFASLLNLPIGQPGTF